MGQLQQVLLLCYCLVMPCQVFGAYLDFTLDDLDQRKNNYRSGNVIVYTDMNLQLQLE